MNKICVYAICHNEMKFVNKWLDSMQEADYIVVLDTGSDDGTYEALKNDSRVYKVEQKVITPWRFDVARNESMKLIPEDANILICTDFDEILHPGWAKALREKWIDGFHIRGYYQYIWSHTNDGKPGRIFLYDKIHDRNWIWACPVHEMLEDTLNRGNDYLREHTITLWNEVVLEHFPDPEKSRGSYLGLLELRAKERPDDYYGLFFLSHEYFYREMYDKSIEILKDIVSRFSDHFTLTELAGAYLFLGDDYRKLDDKEMAIYYYNLGINVEPTFRECYLNAAEIFNELKMYDIGLAYVNTALKKCYRHYVWLERDNSYNGQPEDILSISYYYLALEKNCKDKLKYLTKSYQYVNFALSCNPNDDRLKNNKKLICDTLINELNKVES